MKYLTIALYALLFGLFVFAGYKMWRLAHEPKDNEPNMFVSKYVPFVDTAEIITYKRLVLDAIIVIPNSEDTTKMDSIFTYHYQ